MLEEIRESWKSRQIAFKRVKLSSLTLLIVINVFLGKFFSGFTGLIWKVVPNLYLSCYMCHQDSIRTTQCLTKLSLAFIDKVCSFSMMHGLLTKCCHIPRESEDCILQHVHHTSLLWEDLKTVSTWRSVSIGMWSWEAEDCIRRLKHLICLYCIVSSSLVTDFWTCMYINCPITSCAVFCL